MAHPPPNEAIRLTTQERELLDGRRGTTVAKALRLQIALAKIHGAERFVEVSSVQVSGVSYHNLGEAGLQLLEEWAKDGGAGVPTATLNPAGMDLQRWKAQGMDPDFAAKQLAVVKAYTDMDIIPACTCTPYLAGNLPRFGESIAWAESSAVTFANSVLGARTNREGGPAALAAALTGRTPYWGLHIEQNRAPDVLVEVTCPLDDPYHWGALGAFIGKRRPEGLPYIRVEKGKPPRLAELKSLSAALPTYGARPMFHLEGVTPDAHRARIPEDRVSFDVEALSDVGDSLKDDVEHPDLVCLGCPHATLAEMKEAAKRLEKRKVAIPFWLCTSRAVYELAKSSGILKTLKESGVDVVCDTCFVVAPLRGRFNSVVTNSAKGCYYSRGHNRLKVITVPTETCIEVAVTGSWPRNER